MTSASLPDPLAAFGTPARADRAALDRLPWVYESGPCRALDWSFSVRTTHAGLGRYLEDLLAPLASEEPNVDHCYSVIAGGLGRGDMMALYADEEKVRWTTDAGVLLERLQWHINQSVIASGGERLVLVHAGVVERKGRAALLVAPMESGKTTLTAGLVQRGCGYLSDEVAALVPDTLEVLAYPKPLSVDRGSWSVLPALRPRLAAEVAPFVHRQWLVPPDAIRPRAVSHRALPAVIVLPRYTSGAGTTMEPVSRATAMVEMATETFDAGGGDRHRAFRTLARMLPECATYRLIFDDLDTSCQLVIGALDRA